MPKTKTYDVPLTAMEMFYTRWAVRNFLDLLRDQIADLNVMDPKNVEDAGYIHDALTRKTMQMERLNSALDKMLTAGANNENPYL